MRHLQGCIPSPSEGKWLRVEDLPLAEIGPQKRREKGKEKKAFVRIELIWLSMGHGTGVQERGCAHQGAFCLLLMRRCRGWCQLQTSAGSEQQFAWAAEGISHDSLCPLASEPLQKGMVSAAVQLCGHKETPIGNSG